MKPAAAMRFRKIGARGFEPPTSWSRPSAPAASHVALKQHAGLTTKLQLIFSVPERMAFTKLAEKVVGMEHERSTGIADYCYFQKKPHT
jgi:hypothetical protein